MRLGALALVAVVGIAGASRAGEEKAHGRAPLFEPPALGSYELPPIQRVAEHELLDAAGEPARLLGLQEGQCALVAFVYLSCRDAHGCPLALASLQRVDRTVAGRAELAGRVRLATVSFDPKRDRPEAMANLRHHMKPKGDWRFLTARDARSLHPVLADFGQDAVPVLTRDGEATGVLDHVTKVFLVDDAGRVRNVYSSGFLDPRVVVRDVETLLLARPAR